MQIQKQKNEIFYSLLKKNNKFFDWNPPTFQESFR